MTKKATPPEVWDYVSADAFLKAGRDKDRRPLKDGWNTVLKRVGADMIAVGLHGEPVVTYTVGDHIIMTPDKTMSFVSMQRIQKYGLGSRYMLEKISSVWAIFGESERLAYSLASEDGVPLYAMKGVMPELLELDDKREIITPLARIRWNIRDELRMWRKKVKVWTSEYMKQLQKGEMKVGAAECSACRPIVAGSASLGLVLNDPEHLFAHVQEGVYPPEVVVDAMTARGNLKEFIALSSTGVMTPVKGKELTISTSLQAHMTRNMRAY